MRFGTRADGRLKRPLMQCGRDKKTYLATMLTEFYQWVHAMSKEGGTDGMV